ncbi:calcium-binding protein [Nocardioides oleivorans]|uniref:Calcium-binding protein n=1 Tax=Nocardioides oleivorans TaxID=273676 RepID=A0A4Q2S1E4_9ACTN|nr:calcium-binding protein [Nocardioides oleivorans]RYB94129.1 calcium-binding protein [Nocardioides oleivorans]
MRRTATATALIGIAVTALAPVAAAAPARAAETCDGKVPTIVVPESTSFPITPVQGTAGDDVILGSSRRDVIEGLGGNDTICGLAGADRIFGGEGDDRLFGGLDEDYYPDDGYYGDHLAPGPGDDFVDLGHDPASEDIWWGDRPYFDVVAFEDAPGPVTVDLGAGTATGEGTDTIAPLVSNGGIAGSAYDDVLIGSAADDFITGGAGEDRIESAQGDDLVYPDADWLWAVEGRGDGLLSGDDRVSAGPGADEVISYRGADDLDGGAGNDALSAMGRDQGARLDGGSGSDYLASAGGSDLFGFGGLDALEVFVVGRGDVLDGGPGVDRLTFGASRTVVPRGSRLTVDRSRARIAVDGRKIAGFVDLEGIDFNRAPRLRLLTYVGGRGPDHVDGSAARRVRAWGRGGDDRLLGSGGRDLLDGGPGRDVLDGRQGRDRCLAGERLRSCEVRR